MNIDPTTTAEHKRREEYDAMMRNLTATQTECTRLLQQKRELDAMLRMAAEDVVSRNTTIRDLRIELAAESAKVGEQATEIDRLRNALNGEPKVGKRRKQLMRALGMQTAHASEHEPNWEVLLEKVEDLRIVALRATDVAKTETTVQCGAAEWLDAKCPDGWGCERSIIGSNGWYAYNYGIDPRTPYCQTPRLAREALARSLGWTGGKKAPPSAQEAVERVEGSPVGSEGPGTGPVRLEPTSSDPATVERDDEPIPYRVTTKASGPACAWDHCADCRHKHKSDDDPPCDECAFSDEPIGWEPEPKTPRRFFSFDESDEQCTACKHTLGECKGGGLRCDVDCPHFEKGDKGDSCPLPERWEWVRETDESYRADSKPWGISVWRFDGMWSFNVAEDGWTRFEWERKTRKGAMRAAEKAARRAWRIRAGRKA